MNYQETIEKIHSFQRFGSRLGLERMAKLMDILGNPQKKMKVIHVAGTNGKGSVCRYLDWMLRENGYRTGIYSSPYLERFTERIEYNGEEISEEDLVSCAQVVFKGVDEMLAQGLESPTEFELVTAIGFLYFSRKPLDILILEVGLGGRGDSTNIIEEPLATVITSISYDHMSVLGNSLVEIAGEKAGIIKTACPVIFKVDDKAAADLIRETAKSLACDYFDLSNIKAINIEKSLKGYSFTLENTGLGKSFRAELSMIGMHQVDNAICALSVIEVLGERGIIRYERERLKSGLKKALQKGRLEILKESPLVVVDGAHNIAGVKALTQVIREHFSQGKLMLVMGMLAEKEIEPMVKELCAIGGDIVVTEPDNPLRLAVDDLCQAVRKENRQCLAIGNWEEAYAYIEEKMCKYDSIVITGSLYLIGRIRGKFVR